MTSTVTPRARARTPGAPSGPRQRAPQGQQAEQRDAEQDHGLLHRALPFLERLESPVTTYYVLLSTTAILVVIGLVMVLSASMITSYREDGSSFTVFLDQAKFAAIGIVLAAAASRVPVHWYRKLALPALIGALALEALVFTRLGVSVNGNRNWVRLGVQIQPSEVLKLALILIGAAVLAKKRKLLDRLRHVIVPFLVPIVLVTVGLVLAGRDLGTGLILIGIVGALLFVSGVPARFFILAATAFGAVTAVLVITSQNRMDRITQWLSNSCTDPDGTCGQSVHGLYALADGGWWGVGLGASKEKWSWLPEAPNDFIFAIIGEELGLPGTLVILALFTLLAWGCYRLVQRSRDQFVRVATAGVMAWILLQTMINIGAVIGLLPVIGVPLPLVSAGGSALVTTLLALGMLLSFARNEPGARDILAARPSVVRRSLAVLPRRRQR
ncbi:MAG: putative lipid II flippase FtsW [Actinomycetota bacterium]|nr:putative lipid II flippase FtsW [Actinomycetota bacterium]